VRRIFIIALLVALVLIVGYVVWNHNRGNVFGDGAIVEHNPASSSDQTAMNSGTTTDLDGNTDIHPTPSRSDDPGTINTVPVGSTGTTQNTPAPTSSPTMGTPMSSTPTPAPSPLSAPGGLPQRTPVLGPGAPPPASDTIPPNPPNHVAFGGTGKYMWYRQGDITWRVNSDTGMSCVAFATMQEWARAIVFQNGCDSRRG